MSNPVQPTIRYHRVAIALHWLIAVALVMQLALGFRLDDIPRGPLQFDAFQWHKSLGISILLLSLLRLALRVTLPRPADVASGMARLAARATHMLLYVAMIGAPLTGWAMVSTDKLRVPTILFGILRWPHLPLGAWMNGPSDVAHSMLGWLFPALIALHVAAALWHHLHKDDVLARMMPAGRNLNTALMVAAIVLGGTALLGWAGPVPNLWRAAALPALAPTPSEAVSNETAGPSEAPPPKPGVTVSDSATARTAAPSPNWAVQPGSSVGWSTQWSGAAIEGDFTRWTARIRFDEADLPHARIAVTVDLASSTSGDASRDEAIQGPQFFNTAADPRARFIATRVSKAGSGYVADGTLSLNGVTRPAKLRFTVRIDGDHAIAKGTASLNRLAFKVGTDEWQATDQIPDAVTVHFSIQAQRKAD